MQESNLILGKSKLASTLAYDPSNKGSSVTLSNSNKTMTASAGHGVRGTISHSTGKWYCEFLIRTIESGNTSPVIGIATTNTSLINPWQLGVEEILKFGETGAGVLLYGAGQPRPAYGTADGPGITLGVALDMDSRTLAFYRNGVNEGTITIATYSPGTNFFPFVGSPASASGSTMVDMLAGKDLKYPLPPNYLPW